MELSKYDYAVRDLRRAKAEVNEALRQERLAIRRSGVAKIEFERASARQKKAREEINAAAPRGPLGPGGWPTLLDIARKFEAFSIDFKAGQLLPVDVVIDMTPEGGADRAESRVMPLERLRAVWKIDRWLKRRGDALLAWLYRPEGRLARGCIERAMEAAASCTQQVPSAQALEVAA